MSSDEDRSSRTLHAQPEIIPTGKDRIPARKGRIPAIAVPGRNFGQIGT